MDEATKQLMLQIADAARKGVRCLIASGKVKSVRNGKPDALGQVPVYGEIITGEGDTVSVTFGDPANVPAIGKMGSFLFSPRMFRGELQGFVVTAWA